MLFTSVFDYFYLIIGALLSAVAASVFYTPARLTGGGATGIGAIFYYVFGLDQGIVMMGVNLLLFLLGVKFFGIKYGIRALIGSTLLSLFVSVIGSRTGYNGVLDYSSQVNVILSAIYGGVLMGAGIGLVLKSGCNTGGTDIIAQVGCSLTPTCAIMSVQVGCSLTPFSFGSIQFFFNAIIVITGGLVTGLQPMLFSIIAMFCSSQMVNFVITGFNTNLAKACFIFSDYHLPEISERVIKELHRSGTVLHGTGIYTAKNRNFMLVVVPNQQLQALTKIINAEDPLAFVIVTPAYEVIGKGFLQLKKVADQKS